MRIALGLHSLQLGGSQVNTVDLAGELRRRGHEVVLWAIEGQPYKATIEAVARQAGFDIRKLKGDHRLEKQARHVRDLVDEVDAQILHVHHENHWLGPVASVATRSRPNCAVVVTNWMMEPTHYLPRHASLIVGFPALRDLTVTQRPGPVSVIEPPVNTARDRMDDDAARQFRCTYGLDENEVAAVLVTRVDREMKLEAIEQAVRAIVHADHPSLRLVIVGDGDAMGVVRQLINEANESLGRVAIVATGALADPRPAYAGADVILGMGGSALRGLAFGKPVIVQGAGTFSRTLTEDTAPYFLEHGLFGTAGDDPTGLFLAGRIEALMDRDARRRVGSFSRELVEQRYSLDVLTTKLEDVYRDAIRHPLSWSNRWSDVAYVSAYYAAGRLLSPNIRHQVRKRIPRLRSGKGTTLR